MRPAMFLAFAFIAIDVAIGFWDVIAVNLRRPRDTVSFVIREWAEDNLLLVLAVGVILGHLFGPVRQYPSSSDLPPLSAGGVSSAGGQSSRVHSLLSLAAYVPVAVGAFLLGWFLLWRYFDGDPNSKEVAGGGPRGIAPGSDCD